MNSECLQTGAGAWCELRGFRRDFRRAVSADGRRVGGGGLNSAGNGPLLGGGWRGACWSGGNAEFGTGSGFMIRRVCLF